MDSFIILNSGLMLNMYKVDHVIPMNTGGATVVHSNGRSVLLSSAEYDNLCEIVENFTKIKNLEKELKIRAYSEKTV